jgi:arginyl-tRNA synthetase
MPAITEQLSAILGDAFAQADLDPAFGRVTVSNRPDLAQFQCNGALAAAKQAGANPRGIAESVAESLRGDPIFRNVEIAGPGFLNLTLADEALGEVIDAMAQDPHRGISPKDHPATVLLDYGGPNIAKPMHVGHLRASIIGDCLRRLCLLVGDHAVGDVHMGDWGLPMGMLISELAIRHPDWPYFDPNHEGPYPKDSPVSMADLEALYPEAAAACKQDPARLDQARAATAALQNGEPGPTALWRHFMDVSIAGMKRDFGALGVHFDLWKGEADVHDLIASMIEELKDKGLAELDQGAWIVRVAESEDKKEVPPLILLKSDGAVMYGTTDLATILDRTREHAPDFILYIVDQRQSLHFEQVFRAARKVGYDRGAALEHLGFGTMNGPDGKPFKTRAGGVMKLQDLLTMAQDKALERMAEAHIAEDYGEEERRLIARQVGIGAVKFADLMNHRTSNYVFDLDRFTRFEGKTGPYLQYAAVRVKSLLRRASAQGDAPGAIVTPGQAERDLMLVLGEVPAAVSAAYAKRAPNELCEAAYGLAQAFSRFYANTHILSDPDSQRRAGLLGLAHLTLDHLTILLETLGIEVPERM